MFLTIRTSLLFIFVLSLLTACHSMVHTETKHDKKVTAAEINVQLGMAYIERHELQRAKQKFLKAMREAPQLPEVWYSMAYFFEITGEKDRANYCYLKALELAPKRGDTNNNYGTYLCRSHRYKEAIKHFMIATQDVEYLDVASAYENAGLCAEMIPSLQQAEQYFEAALKQDPSRASSLLGLAEVKYQEGHYEAANSYLNQYLLLSSPTKESKALRVKLNKKGIQN